MRTSLIVAAALAGPVPLAAQTPVAGEGPPAWSDADITRTVTGTPIELEDTGQPVTVIDRAEIARVQGGDIVRVLRRVPGLTVSRAGAPGAPTGVRLRGARPDQVLVLVDGVRLNDPAAPGRGFDFAGLRPGTIDKIDLLRGTNSVAYGPGAIGGVLTVRTRAETGLTASAEYGGRDTAYAAASGGVQGAAGFVGLTGDYYRTDGLDDADGARANEGWSVGGRGRLYLSPTDEMFASARYAQVEGAGDTPGVPAASYAPARARDLRRASAALGVLRDTGPLFLTATASFADTRRRYENAGATPLRTQGDMARLEARGEWRPIGPLLVNFGGDYEWSGFDGGLLADQRGTTRRATGSGGGFAQLGIEYGALSAHAGARHDEHRDFGGATSFGADVSYAIAPDLRLRASVAEGFEAPTLFQLFSAYGNAELRPGRATSYDLGIAYGNRSDDGYGAVTLFRRDGERAVQFLPCTGAGDPLCAGRDLGIFANRGRTRAQGVEIEGGKQLDTHLAVRGVYSFTRNEDRSRDGSGVFGADLPYSPRHALTVSLDWQSPLGLELGGDVRLVSEAFADPANAVRLPGAALADIRATWPLANGVALFGRVENITDAGDEAPLRGAGYRIGGRSAHIGARLTL